MASAAVGSPCVTNTLRGSGCNGSPAQNFFPVRMRGEHAKIDHLCVDRDVGEEFHLPHLPDGNIGGDFVPTTAFRCRAPRLFR